MKKYCLDGEIASFDYHSESGAWAYCGPKSLKKFLGGCKKGEKCEIEINSIGGSVIYGVEMANAIKNSDAHVIAHVTGVAASMASVIACACDEIVMEEASFMMIHDPWTELAGNADALRKEANLLDQMKEVCMSFYRGKFRRCDEDLAKLMSEETWYTGRECLENGLVCTVNPASEVLAAAKMTERSFARMPEAAAKFVSVSASMPAEIAAEIEAAKAAAELPVDAATPDTSAQSESADTTASQDTATERSETTTEAEATSGEDSSSAADSTTSDAAGEAENLAQVVDAGEWERRFKGASKKINELQAQLKECAEKAFADVSALEAKIVDIADTATAKENDFKGKIDGLERDLAAAKTEVSTLSGKVDEQAKALEAKDQELAVVRDGLARAESEAKHLRETRSLLTAGVLNPGEDASYEAQMRDAKTPEQREALRAKKRAGKIK